MSPYRNPRVLVALVGIAAAGVAVILLLNARADGATRTIATVAVAITLWLALSAVVRLARRG